MVATLSILSAALAAASVFSGFASAQQSRVRIIFSGGEIAQFGPRGQCVRRSSQYITSLDISQHVDCVFYSGLDCNGLELARTITGESNYPYASRSKYDASLRLASVSCEQLTPDGL